MFKRFLMDNAHRSHIQTLFRWWNGHVFAFNTRKKETEDHREDSGMDEALNALDSDGDFGSGAEDFYLQEEPQAGTQHNELSVDFFNLTISDHGLILPSVPVAPFTAPVVCESTPAFNMAAPRVRGSAAASQNIHVPLLQHLVSTNQPQSMNQPLQLLSQRPAN
jgi:hypothetical protein